MATIIKSVMVAVTGGGGYGGGRGGRGGDRRGRPN